MQRRVRQEEALEEVGGDERVQRHAELDIVAKPRGPLQHHQGPDPLAGERLGGLGDLVEEMALLLASRPRHHLEEGALAEVREGPAELGLEEHDESQHPEGPEIVEDPLRAVEYEHLWPQRLDSFTRLT